MKIEVRVGKYFCNALFINAPKILGSLKKIKVLKII